MPPLMRIRLQRGLRAEQVAVAAGLSLSGYRLLESGRSVGARVATLLRVASALGVAASDLMPGLAKRPRGKGEV